MYVCLGCYSTFENPLEYKEDHGETFYICPNCEDTDFKETFMCDCCGEYVNGEYVEIDQNKYCENCFLVKDIANKEN